MARSQLLEGAGGLYSGSARGHVPSLISVIKSTINRIFEYALHVIFLKEVFFFEVQWGLLSFACWPHQKTGFAHRLQIDTSYLPCSLWSVWRLSWRALRASQNWPLKTKRREERGEKGRIKGRGGRGEREKKRQQTAPLNGSDAAHAGASALALAHMLHASPARGAGSLLFSSSDSPTAELPRNLQICNSEATGTGGRPSTPEADPVVGR